MTIKKLYKHKRYKNYTASISTHFKMIKNINLDWREKKLISGGEFYKVPEFDPKTNGVFSIDSTVLKYHNVHLVKNVEHVFTLNYLSVYLAFFQVFFSLFV